MQICNWKKILTVVLRRKTIDYLALFKLAFFFFFRIYKLTLLMLHKLSSKSMFSCLRWRQHAGSGLELTPGSTTRKCLTPFLKCGGYLDSADYHYPKMKSNSHFQREKDIFEI